MEPFREYRSVASSEKPEGLSDFVLDPDDAGGEQGGVFRAGISDGQGPDRHSARHLHIERRESNH